MKENKQIDEMAEMLEIIAKAREDYANDVTDRTENEYIREALLDAGYAKRRVGEWKETTEPLGAHSVDCVGCSACGDSWVLDEDFDFDTVVTFWHYCPTCGAKMKGE